MELSIFTQILEHLKKSQNITILLPPKPRLDTVSSALAIEKSLALNGLNARVVGQVTDERFTWLPGYHKPETAFSSKTYLSIEISETNAKAGEVKYETMDGTAKVLLFPKSGTFSEADVKVNVINEKPDCIILIGAQNLDQIITAYSEQADLLYSVPKINIDNHADNQYFGNINLVDLTASSLSEMTHAFIKNNALASSSEIATLLLAGIIDETQSFQDMRTTPASLEAAGELMTQKADHDLVVKMLYKNKELRLIKLWGRTLARINQVDSKPIIYSILGPNDHDRTDSEPYETLECVKETINITSDYKIIAVVSETDSDNHLTLALHKSIDPSRVAFNGINIQVTEQFREFNLAQVSTQDTTEMIVNYLGTLI